jgi:hypothetical protein
MSSKLSTFKITMSEVLKSGYVVVGAQVKGFKLELLSQGLKLLTQLHQFPLVLGAKYLWASSNLTLDHCKL